MGTGATHRPGRHTDGVVRCHTEAMTPASSTTKVSPGRLLLAALAATFMALLGVTTASAATPSVAETRVGVSTPATAHVVGPHECITAGQRWGNAPPQAKTVVGSCVAAKGGDEFVDLASAARRKHILDGEVRPNGTYGGGHRPGTGFPNKSEFPSGWSDERIMHEIADVATDPSLVWRAGDRAGDYFVNGARGGIDIEVLIRNNQIWTGYPTNTMRNAP